MSMNQKLSAQKVGVTERPLVDLECIGVAAVIVTKDLSRLTGITEWHLEKLRDAGVITPFKCGKAKNCRNLWRRDEVLKALGFRPVCSKKT